MNGNTAGSRTLAYLRGEKDLFQDREQFARVKKQFQDSGLPSWLSDAQKRKAERFWKIASLLQENSRMSLTEMSSKLRIPISTLYDTLKEVEKHFYFTIVLRETEKNTLGNNPTTFEYGYQVTAGAEAQRTLNA